METSIYTSGEYLAKNATWHAEDSPFKGRWIYEILSRNGVSPKSIGEIGCGVGEILVDLAARYPDADLTGFEISPQALEIARTKQTGQLTFSDENILETGRSGFDVMIAADVFEHVPDYLGFLEKLRGAAEYKVFHIPLDMTAQLIARESPIISVRNEVGHLHYFSKYTALETLIYCGYEVIDWNYTDGSKELPNRNWKSKALNLPRGILNWINKDLSVRVLGGCSLMVLTR